MSTRSIIARPLGDGFEGRYCHSDGYPSGVGKHLHEQYHSAFGGDLDAMVKVLIEDEEIGWSSICGYDLSKPACWVDTYGEGVGTPIPDDLKHERGYVSDYGELYKRFGPQSYTHRGETLAPDEEDRMLRWTGNGEDLWGTEWAYVLSPMGLMVFGIGKVPTYLTLVPWEDSPDWERVECGDSFERCGHVDGYHEMLAEERKAS